MVEEVTLDSSILVSALVKDDVFRTVARRIMEKIFRGQYHATTSATVPVEVCGAISKRAGANKAILAKSQLIKWENMNLIDYIELTRERGEEAIELAIKLRMSGMDAIVVQAAKEKKAVLLTFDDEMAEKAKKAIKVLTPRDLRM